MNYMSDKEEETMKNQEHPKFVPAYALDDLVRYWARMGKDQTEVRRALWNDSGHLWMGHGAIEEWDPEYLEEPEGKLLQEISDKLETNEQGWALVYWY